jgi:spore germination cell wall hydrolase CwlJ-like protein
MNKLLIGSYVVSVAAFAANVVIITDIVQLSKKVETIETQLTEAKTEIKIQTEEAKKVVNTVKRLALSKVNETIQLSSAEQKCLAKNIYHEAGIDSYEGKIAVAEVTYNRLKSGKWGDNLCKVVYAKAQFSWTLDKKKRYEQPEGQLWEDSRKAARDFLSGTRITQLKQGLFYHQAKSKQPGWVDPNQKIGEVGAHVFYLAAN